MHVPQLKIVRSLDPVPKGRCMDHIHAVLRLAAAVHPAPPHYCLAGGWTGGSRNRVWHTWIEGNSVVLDLTLNQQIWPRAEYYRRFSINPNFVQRVPASIIAALVLRNPNVTRKELFP